MNVPDWATIRSHILDSWEPAPDAAQFSRWEQKNIRETWRETGAVANTNAWRATTALCGQLIEAHLKQRLMQAEASSSERNSSARSGRPFSEVKKAALKQLIDAAISDGILSSKAKMSLVENTSTVKELRNWASHGAAWIRSPGELEATVSMILLVCYSGWLFPPKKPDQIEVPYDADRAWWADRASSLHPNTAAAGIAAFRQDASLDWAIIAKLGSQILRYGDIGAINNMLEGLTRTSDGQKLAYELAENNLVHVIAAAGRGRARHAIEIAGQFRRLGLRAHGRAIAACLPRDSKALAYFIERSPSRFVQYLNNLREVDPRILEKTLRNQESQERLLASLGELLSKDSVSLSTVAALLYRFPKLMLENFFHVHQDLILRECTTRDPWQSVALVRSATGLKESPLRDNMCAKMVETIALRLGVQQYSSSATMIKRLHDLKLLDQIFMKPLTTALIEAAETTLSPSASHQVLWDTAQYSTRYGRAAIDAAKRVASTCNTWPIWEKMCLLGLLHAVEQPSNVEIGAAEICELRIPEIFNHWELLRIALACLRSSDAVRSAATEILKPVQALLAETIPKTPLSEKLIHDVSFGVSILSS